MKYALSKILIVFVLLFSLLNLISCSANKKEETQPIFPGEKEYIVGIKAPGLSTKGKLVMENEGIIRFVHEDPDSPLFGMELIWSEDTLKVHYRGIEWETDEVKTNFTYIFSLLEKMPQGESEKTKETLDGIDAYKYSIRDDDTKVFFWTDSKGEPMKIQCENTLFPFEISFYKD